VVDCSELTHRSILKVAFFLLPLAIVVASIPAVRDLLHPRAPKSYNLTVSYRVRPDGTFLIDELSREPVLATVVINGKDVRGPLLGNEACWLQHDWTVSFSPGTVPVTLSQQVELIRQTFFYCGRQPPPAALAPVAIQSSSPISGAERTWRYGVSLVWALYGWPGLFLLAWFVAGAALWFMRRRPRDGRSCDGCGYSRAGIAGDSPCPECGGAGEVRKVMPPPRPT
jgi:hypothetical protein